MFKATPLPAFNDNYIWMLTKDDYPGMAVVDPGDAEVVLNAIDQYQRPLKAILITHHHPDHTGGVETLAKQFDIPVYGPDNSPFSGITHPLKTGDDLTLFGDQLHIKEVPGHTLDHITYFNDTVSESAKPQLFSGDTLFLAGCGRLFEGTPAQMLEAMNYFKQLPEETEVYCTHEYSLANLAFAQAVEPHNEAISQSISHSQELRNQNKPTLPSNIATEMQINPFMRSDQTSVQEAAKRYSDSAIDDELATFTVIREWKNNF